MEKPHDEATVSSLSSGARVRNLCSVLVFMVVAAFGASFVSPAEDLPETPYDESETLSCLQTLTFSLTLSRNSVGAVTVPERCRRKRNVIVRAQVGGETPPLLCTQDELALRCTFLC